MFRHKSFKLEALDTPEKRSSFQSLMFLQGRPAVNDYARSQITHDALFEADLAATASLENEPLDEDLAIVYKSLVLALASKELELPAFSLHPIVSRGDIDPVSSAAIIDVDGSISFGKKMMAVMEELRRLRSPDVGMTPAVGYTGLEVVCLFQPLQMETLSGTQGFLLMEASPSVSNSFMNGT